MTAPARTESQLGLIGVDDTPLTAHEQLGFELGWDHAHYSTEPPPACLAEASPLRDGLRAGQAAFGARTLVATEPVRQWLALRLQAWLQHRSVEAVEVTPNYLKQIGVGHCPITRLALSDAEDGTGDTEAARVPVESVVDRVRGDAAFAAGNLAVVSLKAQHAKAAGGTGAHWRDAMQTALRIDTDKLAEVHGLGAAEWRRLAVLGSFVDALPHDEACTLPLLVLPPNRLRLFNPVQALQAFVSQQLLTPGWSQRVNHFEALLASAELKHDFKRFFMALLPRVLERGRLGGSPEARWAVEDAWRVDAVQQRWAEFARRLDAAECEALLCQAAARRLTTRTVVPFSSTRATEGWSLPTRGYVPYRLGAGSHLGRRPVSPGQAGPMLPTTAPVAQQRRLC